MTLWNLEFSGTEGRQWTGMEKISPAIFVAVMFCHIIATQSVHFWQLIIRLAVHVV